MEQPKWQEWLSSYSAPFVVCLAGVGVFVYLSAELHFALIELARFAAMAGLLVLPVGWLVLRPIRLQAGVPLARLGLAALVGYPVTVTLFFELGVLRLEPVYLVLVGLALLACVGLGLRRLRQRPIRRDQLLDLFRAALQQINWGTIFVYLLALLISVPWLRYLERVGDDYVYQGHPDSLLHAAYVQEMYRGVPPAQRPEAAGQPFPRYHILYDVFVMMTSRYSSSDPVAGFFFFAPILLHGLFVMGISLIVRAATRRDVVGWIAAGSVYVFGPVMEELIGRIFAIGAPSIAYFYVNGPALGGLAVAAGTMACLTLFPAVCPEPVSGGRPGGLLHVAAFSAAALYLFKAEFFVLLFPAFLIGLALFAVRERHLQAALSIGTALFSFGFFHLSWQAPSWARLVIKFGIFAEARLLGILALLTTKRYLYQILAQYLAAGHPAEPVLLFLTLLITWRFMQLSPLIPAYCYNRARAFSRLRPWELVLALFFPLAVVFALTLDAAELGGPPRGLLVTVMLIFLAFVSLSLNGSLLGWFIVQRVGTGPAARILAVSVIGSLILVAPVAGWVARQRVGTGGLIVTSGEMAAYKYIVQKTPLESVVAQNERPSKIVSGFSGRRVVANSEDMRELYSVTDSSRATSILRQYDVDYLIEYERSPVRFDEAGLLQMVFEAGSVKVYRVKLDVP